MFKNKKRLLFILLCIIFAMVYFVYDYFQDNEIVIDTAKTDKTIVTPVLDIKIIPEKNMIYCATAQLAWNKLCNDLNYGICNFINQPEYVDKLNALTNVSNFISEDSYVAIAGFGKDHIVEKINELVSSKFPKKFDKLKLDLNLEDALAYSCFYKELKFENDYETFDTRLKLETKEVYVKAFGIKEFENGIHDKFKDQVKIFYHKFIHDNTTNSLKDEFVIELKTKSQKDTMIISTMIPEDTMLKSFEMIQRKITDRINFRRQNNQQDYEQKFQSFQQLKMSYPRKSGHTEHTIVSFS